MPKKEDFHDRLSRFIAYLGLKPTSFEKEMQFSNGSIGKALDEKRGIGSDRLETIFYKYPDLSEEWLMTGRGQMLKTPSMVAQSKASYSSGTTAIIPVDNTGNMMIPIADIKAAAGQGYMNTEVLRTSDFIQLPPGLAKSGKYLCVRIKGHSMSPTLQDGGYVIIRLLESSDWRDLLSDRVYVVADGEGKTYLKRLRNRFKNGGFIVLTSDNPDKATFPNFNLRAEEIISIWYVEWYLSAKLPNIHDQFYSRLERLENNIDDLNRKFEDLERIELKSKPVKKEKS